MIINLLILSNLHNVMTLDCVIFFSHKIDLCTLYKVKEIYFEVPGILKSANLNISEKLEVIFCQFL